MNDQTLLLRQVHPTFVQDGRITSQVFRPTPKDEGHLSVYDGDQITPENSWKHFVSTPNCTSAGVMAVSNVECTTQSLAVIADGQPFPEHISINYTQFSENEIKKKAKVLKSHAEARGWLYSAC